MNFSSDLLIAGGSLVVSIERDGLDLFGQDVNSRTLVSGYHDISFLTASRYGEYLAFWSFSGESFRLIDLSGKLLWSSWMNTDKAVPCGIKFSTSGDAVACFFHFEGVPGIFFCDIEQGFSTTFGCCGRPIGHDADLRYFTLSDYDPLEYERVGFYEKKPDSGNMTKLPREVVSQKLDNSPLLVDRNRCILSQPVLLKDSWQGLAIQNDMSGFVILRDRNLFWFPRNSDEPEVTIKDCVPESDRYRSYRTILSLCGDNVLIQIEDRSTVVNRNHGVIWKGDNLSSIILRGNRVLAQYKDGPISVIREDGSEEMKYPPTPGVKVYAADNIDNVLYIAEAGRRFEIKTCNLSD